MPRKVPFTPINRIREIRIARGLTLRDVADALGTTATQINRFERGERDIGFAWLRAIARVLSVAPADLLLPEDGGLTERERAVIDTLHEVPAASRAPLFAVAESLQPYRSAPAVLDHPARLEPPPRKSA